jgi:RNA polymerase sigma-70 factor (ECF subfamily)
LAEAWRLLDALLAKLPDKLRRALVLAEIEGLEVAEIAELERIPVGTAASRLRRARERFRSALAKEHSRNPFGGSP